MIKRLSLLFLLVLIAISPVFAQKSEVEKEPMNISLVQIGAGFHLPAADLAVKFGPSASIGLGYQFKMKSNWQIGIESNFFFGSEVKNDSLLYKLSTGSPGNELIINKQGTLSDLQISERGYNIQMTIGKVLPLFGPNQNSGLLIKLGGGFMEHWIRIEGDEQDVSYLDEEMKKGYDELTNGFNLYQFIGYQHLSNNQKINYYVGLESYQLFSKNRRGFNYNTRSAQDESRTDILYGIKIGWTLPLYPKIKTTYYY